MLGGGQGSRRVEKGAGGRAGMLGGPWRLRWRAEEGNVLYLIIPFRGPLTF